MWLNFGIRFRGIDIVWDAIIARISTEESPNTGKPKDKTMQIKSLTGAQEDEGALDVQS